MNRAGGHVLRGGKWVPATRLAAEPAHAVEPVQEWDNEPAPGETWSDGTAVGQVPERLDCPDCGKEVATRKDGSLRKHTCVMEAPEPAVTFDQAEEVTPGVAPDVDT